MIRTRLLVVTVATALAFSACSDVTPAAVRVDDRSVSRADFEDQLAALAEAEGRTEGGTASADYARSFATFRIQGLLQENLLDDLEGSVTDEDRAEASERLSGAAAELPEDVVDMLVHSYAVNSAFQRAATPSVEEIEASYAEPAGAGTLCLRHILLETEEDAEAVLDELEGGADFAELAEERSTDPSAQGAGGALNDSDGSPCIPVSTYEAGFDPDFVAAALTAVPGEPLGPVATSFGYHVILARPFDEVAEDVVSDASASAANDRLLAALDEADVEIDPRYGTWDPDQRLVVPASGPASTG